MELVVDENGNESIPRLSFIKELIYELIQGLSEEGLTLPVQIKSIRSNHIVVPLETGEDLQVNLGDVEDLDLMFLAYVLVGSANYTLPKLRIHFLEDEEEEILITGIELLDFAGVIVSSGAINGTLSVELGCKYLRNVLRMNQVISLSDTDDKPMNLSVSKNESDSVEGLIESFEASKTYSMAKLKLRQKQKGKRVKKLKMARRTDMAGHRKRSKAAKLRWRKFRGKILKGQRRFRRSAQGKKLAKMVGKLNES